MARTLSAHMDAAEDGECAAPKRPLRKKADPISFAFFVGILIAVLLVPAARLSKREYSSRE